MPEENNTVYLIRAGARVLVGVALAGTFIYLVVSGGIEANSFADIAPGLIAAYLALDGVAKVATH